MTPREPGHSLRRILERQHRAHRLALALRFALRAGSALAVAVAAVVLAGAAIGGGQGVARLRLGLFVLAAGALLARAVVGFLAAAPRFEAFLERIERRFPDVRSWLRNALDLERRPSAYTSGELAAALAEETARRVGRLPLATTTPRVEPRRPLAALAAALGAVVLLGLIFPAQVTRSWRTLWDPALAAPPVRLEVEPGSVRITPGAALAVRARVWGRTRAPRIERPAEASPPGVAEGDGEAGGKVWRFDLTQLTRDQTYLVRAENVSSPIYRITLAGEPSPVSFEIEYDAPPYARLPVQHGSATRGDLSALRGTRAHITVTFDRDLRQLAARVTGGRATSWTALTPRRWTGEITLDRDGEYELLAVAASGRAGYRYRLTPLADSPPVLAVQLPAGDLDLPAGQQIPIAVLGQDDLGLSQLRLQYRKDPESPWQALGLARFDGHPREAEVHSSWDASVLGLLPGQTATFRFELEDNNTLTGPGRAVSPTFELRFPGLAELYDQFDRSQGSVRQTLEKAADQARDLQQSLDKLSRQPPRTNPESAPSFERSEELKSAVQRQQDLTKRIDQASDQLHQALDRAAERQAFNEELMSKLHEMSELVKQIQSQEFRDALRRMQEALENMDRRQLEQSLPAWQQQNHDMLQQLQRTIELLKQLRNEEQMAALAKRAAELKQQQDALNQQHASEQTQRDAAAREEQAKSLAQKQEEAAKQSEKLAQDARDLAQASRIPEDHQGLDQAASELEQQAAPDQHEASRSASQQKGQQASSQGQKASESLARAADKLQSLAQAAQQRRQSADLAAIRRAAQDLVSLQRESEINLSANAPVPDRADRQTDLSDGVGRVADSLSVLARQQPFISPKLGQALGRAITSLSSSGRELAGGDVPRGEQSGRVGSSALNQAILELRRTESQMCNSSSMAGGSKKSGGNSGEQIGALGERQSQLNEESRSIAERLTQQMRLSAGDQEQMRQLAERQRQIREQLEQIQRDEELKHELLGRLDATQQEMKDVEEILKRGDNQGELEEKQQRILSRLLDDQRSVNRRDFDPQRESRPGEDVQRASAPELPPDALHERDRLRLDLLKADADRYPAQYRAYVEAYLRALNAARAGSTP